MPGTFGDSELARFVWTSRVVSDRERNRCNNTETLDNSYHYDTAET